MVPIKSIPGILKIIAHPATASRFIDDFASLKYKVISIRMARNAKLSAVRISILKSLRPIFGRFDANLIFPVQ
jgi:hypothetical protein